MLFYKNNNFMFFYKNNNFMLFYKNNNFMILFKYLKKHFNSEIGFVHFLIIYFFLIFTILVYSDYIFYLVINQESKMSASGYPIFEEEVKYFSGLIVSFTVPFTAFLICSAVLFAFFYSSFLYLIKEYFDSDFDFLHFLALKIFFSIKVCISSFFSFIQFIKEYFNIQYDFRGYFYSLLEIRMEKSIYWNSPAITLRLLLAFAFFSTGSCFSVFCIFFFCCYRHRINFNSEKQLVIKTERLEIEIPNVINAILFFTLFLLIFVFFSTTFYVILFFVFSIYVLCAMHITYFTLVLFRYDPNNLEEVWWALRFFMYKDELERWRRNK